MATFYSSSLQNNYVISPYCFHFSLPLSHFAFFSFSPLSLPDSRLLNFPQNQYVIIGGDVTLHCSFNDANMMYGLAITVTKRGDATVSDVRNASLADEGEYSCEDLLLCT